MATTETAPQELSVRTKGFTYRGIVVSPLDRVLYTNDLGEQAFALSQKSGELRNKAGLYVLGRDVVHNLDAEEIQRLLQRGELSQEDIELSKQIYRDCQTRARGKLPPRGHVHRDLVGHVHRDLVILEPNATIPGTRKPEEDYIVGRVFLNTGGYDGNGKIIEIPGIKPAEERVWLPPNNVWIVPTRYGTNNRLGLPDEGVKDRNTALERLKRAGLPESELMKFYRWNDGSVVVWSGSGPGGGALYVGLYGRPGDRDDWFGSFPASGSARGASRDSEVIEGAKGDYGKLREKASVFDALARVFGKVKG